MHGERLVEGPVFLDMRDGQLVGVCVRNASTDLEFVNDAKYTFSNYGWFLYGYDIYDGRQEVLLVEGVFDAIALRRLGYPAIAFGSAMPHPFQLACVLWKYRKLRVCFDNDFHGHLGAYVTSKLLNVPIVMTELKDPSCYVETRTPIRFRSVERDALREMLLVEIADYNRAIDDGVRLIRPLPYN